MYVAYAYKLILSLMYQPDYWIIGRFHAGATWWVRTYLVLWLVCWTDIAVLAVMACYGDENLKAKAALYFG